MSVPVIGQIRSLQDAQRALENIRSWFMDYTGQPVSTDTINTIVQRTISSTANNNALLKSANLSDVANPTLAFDRIKQSATAAYEGVTAHASNIQTVLGISTSVAVTPASLTAKIDTDETMAADSDSYISSQKATKAYTDSKLTPYNMYIRGHLADLTLVYIPLSVDRLITGILANGTPVTIPLVSGA
jgi:hypothetical protein